MLKSKLNEKEILEGLEELYLAITTGTCYGWTKQGYYRLVGELLKKPEEWYDKMGEKHF